LIKGDRNESFIKYYSGLSLGVMGWFVYKEELPFVFGCLLLILIISLVLIKIADFDEDEGREWAEIISVVAGIVLVWVETFSPEAYDLRVILIFIFWVFCWVLVTY